ncbi:MAG: ribbon-helix-helix protein, CopG family [Proteobacteria bacterium]|nr:ribbon-helix-helix protein, CopG family [Pseudomonadota bacterium]
MSVTSIRLQADVESALQAIAVKLHRSRNWLVNEAIREYVARQETDHSRWQDTLAAMDSVASGKIVSSQAVHAWLASWGNPDELPPPAVGE